MSDQTPPAASVQSSHDAAKKLSVQIAGSGNATATVQQAVSADATAHLLPHELTRPFTQLDAARRAIRQVASARNELITIMAEQQRMARLVRDQLIDAAIQPYKWMNEARNSLMSVVRQSQEIREQMRRVVQGALGVSAWRKVVNDIAQGRAALRRVFENAAFQSTIQRVNLSSNLIRDIVAQVEASQDQALDAEALEEIEASIPDLQNSSPLVMWHKLMTWMDGIQSPSAKVIVQTIAAALLLLAFEVARDMVFGKQESVRSTERLIALCDAQAPGSLPMKDMRIIFHDGIAVHQGKRMRSRVITHLKAGQIVVVAKKVKERVKITWIDENEGERTGWVESKYLKAVKRRSLD